MMIDLLSWVLIVALLVFLAATGGLTSSLLNRRLLRQIGYDMEKIKADAEHAKNNARATKQALEHFASKNGRPPS